MALQKTRKMDVLAAIASLILGRRRPQRLYNRSGKRVIRRRSRPIFLFPSLDYRFRYQ